ncbi:MAG TPA: exo-alpha-sialidase [Planctomycetota bacterium]|nr:exo-alpha-sialidase [Planctomycetota bacterium]HRR81997.1 exo-alpha-sialidase [Planctomycetota bacterium]HRT94449.1 exo-alpha-sialidase [Planctomycetota bacterium]
MKCTMLAIAVLGWHPLVSAGDAPVATLVEVRRIWDQAPHNAFTDLIRFKDRWFCAFREGKGHVCDTGALRVLASADGQEWKSVARMAWDGGDVRDAKLSVTAGGQLMLNGAVRFVKPVGGQTHQSVTWLSPDGEAWGEPNKVADPNLWMWSVTWHKGVGYGIGYACGGKHLIRLYHTSDGRGKEWETLADDLLPGGTYANETSLVFAPDDACYCLLRRDGKPSSAQLGVSKPPYTGWVWRDLGVQIGGPKMIRLPDGRFLATVRLYDKKVRTGLCSLDPEGGRLTEILTLPSGGDTSYAGMVIHDGLLWISYYSSHEGKTSIYLAKVKLEAPH